MPALLTALAFALSTPLLAQTALRVVQSDPGNNRVGAPTATPWRATFDRPVQAASIPGNAAVFGRWSGVVPGTFTLDGTGTVLTFQPARPFFPGEVVNVSLTRRVTAVDGNTLGGGFTAWFWTAPAAGTRSFTMTRLIPMRSSPTVGIITYGAHAGDVDGDGSPDITTCNEASSDLRKLLNDGCGNAGPMVIHPGHGEPSPSESADFDGDGRLDLVTANLQGFSATVFFNDGAGGFLAPLVFHTGGRSHGVTVLDADADGRPDFATTNRTSVLLYRNLGNRTFAAPSTFEAGSGEDGIMACDANGDGRADLFVGNDTASTVALLLGDGNGGFTLSASRSCGGRPFQIAVGDVDGDGDCDVITANRTTATMGVVKGDGLGGLVSTTTYATGTTPVAADLADLDGDGDLDAVVSLYSSSRHDIFWNDGAGNFGGRQSLPTTQNGSCATLVDFDRDGILDIISADEGADEVRIYLQNRPAPAGVQPMGCLATLRVDQWAVGGFGSQPLRPVRAGGTVFFGVTAAAQAAFAVMVGPRQLPGLGFPFGLANLDPPGSGALVFGFLGDPRAITDGNGEASVPVPVPPGLGGSLYAQAVVQDLRPGGAGLLFSNPVGMAFVP